MISYFSFNVFKNSLMQYIQLEQQFWLKIQILRYFSILFFIIVYSTLDNLKDESTIPASVGGAATTPAPDTLRPIVVPIAADEDSRA